MPFDLHRRFVNQIHVFPFKFASNFFLLVRSLRARFLLSIFFYSAVVSHGLALSPSGKAEKYFELFFRLVYATPELFFNEIFSHCSIDFDSLSFANGTQKKIAKKAKSILDRVDCTKNISRIAQTSLHNHFRHLHRNYKNFPLHSQDGGVCLRMGITLLFAWAEWRWDEGCGSFQRIFFSEDLTDFLISR